MAQRRIAGLVLLLHVSIVEVDSNPSCANVPVPLRFDCHPEQNATESNCQLRGCCWLALDEKSLHGEAVPFCFYPGDSGYRVTDLQSTKFGLNASLKLDSQGGPYGNDVKRLAMMVVMETETRLHVKIFDPSSERFEVPIPTPPSNHKVFQTSYTVGYTEYPFGFSVTRNSTNTVVFNSSVGRFIFEDQFLQISSILPSFHLYGLGEHVAPLKLDLNWKVMSLFARDRLTPEGETHNLYGVHPFYLNIENDGNANGVFLLNSNAMDIVLQPAPAITYRTIGGILDFYIFLGPTPGDVIQQYTEVIGRTFMPPYWGLGFHLCRWGYRSLDSTREVVRAMQLAGIPQDTQWNDIDYMDGSRDFTYNNYTFAGLPEFVEELHRNGMHYVVILDPGISNSQGAGNYPPYDDGIKMDIFIKKASGELLVGRVWPGLTSFPDFFHPSADEYWLEQIKTFHKKVPFDGLWIDMNEVSNFVNGDVVGCPSSTLETPPYKPYMDNSQLYDGTLCMTAKTAISTQYNVHSLYGYSETVSTMKVLKTILGKRSIVISRSTYPNSGQHGGHWLGDNKSAWPDLYLSIPGILNFNLFGIPFVGADICGFQLTTTVELCARWMQLGAFYPFSRNHNTKDTLQAQDPPSLGSLVVNASRSALLTRYSLLPYLYTLFHEAHVTGMTVARPLLFEFPHDNEALALDRQFLWGSGLLISPVLEEGATSVTAYFPACHWYDFYNGSEVITSGPRGRNVTLPASMDYVNLHVRGGQVLILQQPNTTTTASRRNPFELIVALDKKNESFGYLFWDDGDSLDTHKKGDYTMINYTAAWGCLNATVVWSGYKTIGSLYLERVKIFGFGTSKQPSVVCFNGLQIESDHVTISNSTRTLTVSHLHWPMNKNFTLDWGGGGDCQ